MRKEDESKNKAGDFVGFGLGLRSSHYLDVTQGRPRVQWFEIVSENYMIDGGRPRFFLEKVRQDFPIACHGVSLNIGSSDPLNREYLRCLKVLIDSTEPFLVSDHLCWTGVDGENLHDLFPLPYREDVAKYVARRVQKVQDTLKRQILLENVSSYITYRNSEMTEWEFINEIVERSGCGLLLDVNNIYVSSVNHKFDPMKYIESVPTLAVKQIHLAGHSVKQTKKGKFLVDTHSEKVCDEVWQLYRETIKRFGPINTMVEWDSNIPTYADLESEILKAKEISDQVNYEKRTGTTVAYSKENTAMGSPR